jgi:hypothetical protein
MAWIGRVWVFGNLFFCYHLSIYPSIYIYLNLALASFRIPVLLCCVLCFACNYNYAPSLLCPCFGCFVCTYSRVDNGGLITVSSSSNMADSCSPCFWLVHNQSSSPVLLWNCVQERLQQRVRVLLVLRPRCRDSTAL